MGTYSRWALIKFSPFSASSKFINKTQIAVINIFKIRILLNLTFRMFVHMHFQKYNRYGFWEAIYIATIGVWNLERHDLE